jgi:hypothetical protein
MINFMSKTFYTYAYLREDRTPYYVGRGKGRRAFDKSHNVKVPTKDRILFLKTGLTFAKSVQHEVYMIAVLGRKDLGTGILRNVTDGGEGTLGYRHSRDTRAEMSRTRVGRLHSSEAKARIQTGLTIAWAEGRHHDISGENNPNADGHHGEKNGRSKLTDDDRRQIALEYTPGKKNGQNGNCSELATRYGVGMSQIRRIARNPRWTS